MLVEAENTDIFFQRVRFILFIVILLFSIFVAVDLLFLNNHTLKAIKTDSSLTSMVSYDFLKKKTDTFEQFLKTTAAKNFFVKPYTTKKSQNVAKQDKTVDELRNSLRLVGILGGTKAIIEDRKSQKSFHLKQNDEFLSGAVVSKITSKSVEIEYNGEIFELYL